jgi:hypothetical protein
MNYNSTISTLEWKMTTVHDLPKNLSPDLMLQCYRRSNIRAFLATSEHSMETVSKALGYNNSTFLGQMVGAYPIRPITEITVRKIEEAFDLEPLSLDKSTEISIDDLSELDRKRLNLKDDDENRAQNLLPSHSRSERFIGQSQEDLSDMLSTEQLLQCYRRSNVRAFLATSGHSMVSVSKELGYTNSSFLGQMVGANPLRPITDKTVRKIEEAFNLEPLSLDKPAEITLDDLNVREQARLNLQKKSSKEWEVSNVNPTMFMELIDMVQESGVPASRGYKILKIGIKDILKKNALDHEYVCTLIDLSSD